MRVPCGTTRSSWNAKVRTPRHPPDLEQGAVRLPQLRGAPAHRRYYRLSLILDKGSFRELDADLAPQDVLQFPGYPEKLEAQTGKTGLKEAVITATGRIEGTPVVVAVLDSRFLWAA